MLRLPLIMADKTGIATGDYQPAPVEADKSGSTLAATFFVFNAWTAPFSVFYSSGDEPRLGHGVPHNRGDLVTDALIAGALYTSCRESIQKFEKFGWRHHLYLAGVVLLILSCVIPNHGLLAAYVDPDLFQDVGDWAVGLALASVLWSMALLVYSWAVWGLESNMTAAVEGLNYPLFQLAGYRAHYRVEPTGPGYTLEHRIYVFHNKTTASGSLLEVIPDSTRPLFAGGKTIFLHTPTLFGTGDDDHEDRTSQYQNQKEYLHRHEQPAMLKSIHPFLWGALHQAFWVEQMDQLRRQRRVRTADVLFVLFLATVWALPTLVSDTRNVASSGSREDAARLVLRSWLLALTTMIAIVAFYFMFLQVLINRTAQTVGHARWTRATKTWGPVLGSIGWRLDYTHPEEEGTDQASTSGSTEYCLQFVPIAEHNAVRVPW